MRGHSAPFGCPTKIRNSNCPFGEVTRRSSCAFRAHGASRRATINKRRKRLSPAELELRFRNRKRAHPLARSSEDGIGDRRKNRRHCRFTQAGGRVVGL